MNTTGSVIRGHFSLQKWVVIGFVLLMPNSGYLIAFADPTLLYLCNVFLHTGLGLLLFVPMLVCGWRFLKKDVALGKELARYTGTIGFWSLAVGAGAGVILVFTGGTKDLRWLLYLHIVLCFIGVVLLTTAIRRVGHQISIDNGYNTAGRWLLLVTSLSVCLPLLVMAYRFAFVNDDGRIHNPHAAPASMEDEAMGGAQGSFFPSRSATTSFADSSAATFLRRGEACGTSGCHPDIYRQWRSSAHYYSGFNNLWYRRALTLTAERLGPTPAKWCAGCHTPALLLSGGAQAPAAAQAQNPAAYAGVTCTSCHAVTDVQGTLGQGGYVVEKPGLFDLAASSSPLLRRLFAWFVHLDSQPHRESFRKPFHANESGAFCSSCHKAHTDHPVNQARWLQIMNDYDSWQSSTFAQGTMDHKPAFESRSCVSCHLPKVMAEDAAGRRVPVRDHRFLGANTFVSQLAEEGERLQATLDFLRDRRISLDLFALARTPASGPSRFPGQPAAADTADTHETRLLQATTVTTEVGFWDLRPVTAPLRPADHLIAPLGAVPAALRPGDSVRLDLVVRSHGIGHNFPGGAADMAQAWLEVRVVDSHERIVFWSGAARGEAGTEVDPAAHFYGTVLADSNGQRTHHDRSWEARAAAYVHLLPPNSSEVVRYRLEIPPDCGNQVKIVARLLYRKYEPGTLAGLQDAGVQPPAEVGDATQRTPTGRLAVLPAVEMARAELTLPAGPGASQQQDASDISPAAHAERWSNYGIGLLRQLDLVNAEAAFQRAAAAAPRDPNHWINLGIVQLRTGRTADARASFDRALELDGKSARALYHLGMAHKAQGNYRKALALVKRATDLRRRDRELRLELGRLYHVLQDYERAIRSYKRALRIDPQDPTVYNAMKLTYLADGDPKSAARVESLARRFTKDEAMWRAEQRARAQQPWWEEAPHLYHEHISAAPEYWPISQLEASNGESTAARLP